MHDAWLRGKLHTIGMVALALSAAGTIFLVILGSHGPTAIGSDPSNYYAAGERLNAGHALYALQPGDRQVGNGGAPNPWSYPFLSPPAPAVLWRALALLPGDVSMYLWWVAGASGSLVLGLWLIDRSNTVTLPFVLVLIPTLSVTAWSGNINALLVPAGALVWLTAARERRIAAGLLVAISGLLKLTPGLFAWWFLVRGDRRALGACLGGAAVGIGLSLAGAGWQSHLQFVAVARESGSIGLSSISLVSVARALGAPDLVALLAPYFCAAVAAAAAWRLRRNARWSFAACAIGVTLGTPTLRIETLAWGLVALVPWATETSLARRARPAPARSVWHDDLPG